MARKSPADKLTVMRRVVDAWQALASGAIFFGLTLAGFKAFIQPSLDARLEIEDLQRRLRIAIRRRDDADRRSMRKLQGVVDGVKGDPAHTHNGALYAAMGYVPKAARRKRRRRKK